MDIEDQACAQRLSASEGKTELFHLSEYYQSFEWGVFKHPACAFFFRLSFCRVHGHVFYNLFKMKSLCLESMIQVSKSVDKSDSYCFYRTKLCFGVFAAFHGAVLESCIYQMTMHPGGSSGHCVFSLFALMEATQLLHNRTTRRSSSR
ncbi:MAG TPA: hypothetical protein PKZ59_12080 [Candidatus Hydrogenedentes bacterium]|nr:hypothetical protein [Candidatus Hydrogenedentota bacterium]